MNLVAWVLLGWIVLALVLGAVATWLGWHLRRARHVWSRSTARNRADDTRKD